MRLSSNSWRISQCQLMSIYLAHVHIRIAADHRWFTHIHTHAKPLSLCSDTPTVLNVTISYTHMHARVKLRRTISRFQSFKAKSHLKVLRNVPAFSVHFIETAWFFSLLIGIESHQVLAECKRRNIRILKMAATPLQFKRFLRKERAHFSTNFAKSNVYFEFPATIQCWFRG